MIIVWLLWCCHGCTRVLLGKCSRIYSPSISWFFLTCSAKLTSFLCWLNSIQSYIMSCRLQQVLLETLGLWVDEVFLILSLMVWVEDPWGALGNFAAGKKIQLILVMMNKRHTLHLKMAKNIYQHLKYPSKSRSSWWCIFSHPSFAIISNHFHLNWRIGLTSLKGYGNYIFPYSIV